MAKITVGLPHVTSAVAEAEIRAVLASEGPEISDCVAVTVASWWQSPGRVGRHLAALASGVPVEYEDLALDVHLTWLDAAPAERRALDCLSTWMLDRTNANTRDYAA
jgi:hypothetical protein